MSQNCPLTLIGLTGARVRFRSESDWASLWREPRFVLFYSLCAMVLVLDNRDSHVSLVQDQASFGGLITIILCVIASGFFAIYACLQIARRLHAAGVISAVYLPLITLTAYIILFSTSALMTLLVTGQDVQDTILSMDRVRDIVTILVFEVFFVVFVAPQLPQFESHLTEDAVEPEPQDPPSAPPPFSVPEAAPKALTLMGKRYPIADLLYVRSEGHHLRCVLKGREIVVRGTLRSVVDAAGAEHGALVNRSTWVAFQAIETYLRMDDKDVVRLHDGHEERVTKTRKISFDTAYDWHQQSSQQDREQ